jgi:hypothetical protein
VAAEAGCDDTGSEEALLRRPPAPLCIENWLEYISGGAFVGYGGVGSDDGGARERSEPERGGGKGGGGLREFSSWLLRGGTFFSTVRLPVAPTDGGSIEGHCTVLV